MKSLRNKLLCAVLSLAMLCSGFSAAALETASFTDWAADAWYAPAMSWCVDKGYFEGTGKNMIEAERPITRAEFLAVMVRYFQCTETEEISFLSDVSPTDWFYNVVSIGYGAGITNGVSAASFAPYQNITREQAFTMYVRALRPSGATAGDLSRYSDADEISGWAVESIKTIIALGIVEGYEDAVLRPAKEISRAEVAQILYRASRSEDSPTNNGNAENNNQGSAQNGGNSNGGGRGGNGGGGSGGEDYAYVRLDPQNGQPTTTQRIVNGRISEPAVPTRDGYYFGGWYTDPKGGYKFLFDYDTAFHGLCLYAHWYTPREWTLVSAMNAAVPMQVYADTELWASRQSVETACAIRYGASNQTHATLRLCLVNEDGMAGVTLFETFLHPGDSMDSISLNHLPEPGTYAARFVIVSEAGATVNLDAVVHLSEP